jgi:O-antigen ligase
MLKTILSEKFFLFLWYCLLLAILLPQMFYYFYQLLPFAIFVYTISLLIGIFILTRFILFFKNSQFVFLILTFFLLVILSSFWSITPVDSFYNGFIFILQILPVSIFALSFEKPKKLLTNTALFLSFLGFIMSFFELLFLKWKGLISFSSFRNNETLVQISYFLSKLIFKNPNCLAFWLFITIAFTILALIETKKWKVFLFFLLPQSIVLFLTFSRATLIALFGFLFCFFFTLRKKEKLLIFVLLIFIISFLIGFIGWKNKGIIPIKGISDRVEIWKLGFKFWKENLILGNGFATSQWLLWERVQNVHFHNNFLQIGVELGILGFLLYLFLWIYPIKIGLRKFNENKMSENIIPLAFILSFEFGTFLNSFFESLITYPPFPFFVSIWFFLTILLVNPYFP